MQGAPSGCFHPVIAQGFAQLDDAQGGAVALFGMGPVRQDLRHNPGAVGPDGFDPFQDAAGRPLQILLMGLGPVFLQRGEAAWQRAAQVGRHVGAEALFQGAGIEGGVAPDLRHAEGDGADAAGEGFGFVAVGVAVRS